MGKLYSKFEDFLPSEMFSPSDIFTNILPSDGNYRVLVRTSINDDLLYFSLIPDEYRQLVSDMLDKYLAEYDDSIILWNFIFEFELKIAEIHKINSFRLVNIFLRDYNQILTKLPIKDWIKMMELPK